MRRMDTSVDTKGDARPQTVTRRCRAEIALAVAAFAVLCVVVLLKAPQLPEPDDFAYRASIVAVTDGHFLSLSTDQVHALARQLSGPPGTGRALLFRRGPMLGSIQQWVRLPDGRWMSEKDPGYPYLAAPFQWLGIIRLAPLFYGALACLGLFCGARRWLGRFGGAAAVGLFCSSGAALLFAWRDYMPAFTEAALIAAGTGALLWAMLAAEATSRRRIWAGLAGFLAIEAAAFTRYTNVVVLGCAVAAVLTVRWRRPDALPPRALRWWLGSAVLFSAGVAVFDDVVYGGPLRSGYRPGEIKFSLGAVLTNLRLMPSHLIQSMPVLLAGLVAIAWIGARWQRLEWLGRSRTARAEGDRLAARRDAAVGLALAASWFGVWGLYAAYTWTALPGLSTLQSSRFYVPAIGAIALLGAWTLIRASQRRAPQRHAPLSGHPAAITLIAVVAAMFGLGIWSFNDSTSFGLGPPHLVHGGQPPPRSGPPLPSRVH
jgi:hypothetical protein